MNHWSLLLAGSDYGAIQQVLFFVSGGPTSQTLTVTILSDSTSEPDEFFTVRLRSMELIQGTAFQPDMATVTITNGSYIIIIIIHGKMK